MRRFSTIALLLAISACSLFFLVGYLSTLNLSTKPEVASRTPQPPIPSATQKEANENWYSLIARGEDVRLDSDEIESYVNRRNRCASSLIAALYLDEEGSFRYLEEAAERYPNDPHVAVEMLSYLGEASAESAVWLNRLKTSAPGNAAPHLFAAQFSFENGDFVSALVALDAMESSSHTAFYSDEMTNEIARAYSTEGLPEDAAYVVAKISFPTIASISADLNRSIGTAISDSFDAGNVDLAKTLAKQGLNVTERFEQSEGNKDMMAHMAAASIELSILNQMEAFDFIPESERELVADRMIAIQERISKIKDLAEQAFPLLESMEETEARIYFQLFRDKGEIQALEWLAQLRAGH